jgi:hypothetical protein
MTELSYHGGGFIEAFHKGIRVFVDPVFSQTRRGRRSRGETRGCDYVLVSHVGDAFEDTLDLLEDHDSASLVGTMDACRTARRELRLDRDRTLDLEHWERATDADVRITAIPITLPTPASAGLGWAQGVGDALEAEVSRMLARSPLAALPTRGMRALSQMPMGRGFAGAPAVGEAALGFSLELGDATVVLLGQGVHDATDERDLEDIADLGAIDTLALEATGSVGAVVRAVRILEPKRVCMYRAHDPYGRGRRALALAGGGMPLSAYVDAIAEDQGGRVEARTLKPGDTIALRANGTPLAGSAKPETTTKPV